MKKYIKDFFKIRRIDATMDLPILCSLCMAIPIFTGYFTNNFRNAMISALAGIIVVYFPFFGSLKEKMSALLGCSFGFIFSYSAGLIFSFNKIIIVFILGFVSFIIHYVVLHFELKPPRSFFFIMVCATASSLPHLPISKIAENVGYLTFGTLSTCVIAFVYSLFFQNKIKNKKLNLVKLEKKINLEDEKNKKIESLIVGIFMSLSLAIGFLLKIKNPYWICVACIAIMQGTSKIHVFKRSIQRMCGTILGVGFCYLILIVSQNDIFYICVSIVVLQFIVEYLVPRNYGIAVIFITPLTILLSEAGSLTLNNHFLFIFSRFENTIIGSILGLIGGFLIFSEGKKTFYKK